MNAFQLKKFKSQYHKHTEHIYSFDFRKTPQQVKDTVTAEELEIIKELPLIRMEETRTILLNESLKCWRDLLDLLKPLDLLPEPVLNDLYLYYRQKMKHVTINNAQTFNDSESFRRFTFCLIPEILWCYGNDNVKSKLFGNQ